MLDSLRDAITNLEQRMDLRFEGVDGRFDIVDRRLMTLDQKLDLRTDALDAKMSRQFLWLVGLQVTTLATIVAAVVAAGLPR
jgi:hypothetical protein